MAFPVSWTTVVPTSLLVRKRTVCVFPVPGGP
jgi:hypothetical protein